MADGNRTRLKDLLDKDFSKPNMTSMKMGLRWIALFAASLVFVSGCCNTKFKTQQLKDDLHAYFADGDYELLSEAEPDSGI